MRSLETRIVALFCVLLLVMQLGSLAITDVSGLANTRARLQEKLAADARVYRRLLDLDAQRLAHAARVLIGDSGFRQSVASGDDAVRNMLASRAIRGIAEVILLVGRDRVVRSDASGDALSGQAFPVPGVIAAADELGEASAVIELHGGIYQVVAVPLQDASDATLVLGFRIDGEDTQALHDLVGLQISYLTHGSDGSWRVDATTHDPATAALVRERMASYDPKEAGTAVSWDLDGAEHLTMVLPQTGFGGPLTVAVIQRSVPEYLVPFRGLEASLIRFDVLALAIAIVCCLLVARGIARPVKRLAEIAGRIASGDFTGKPTIVRNDEIGQLASAFGTMQDSLAARERQILDMAYCDALTLLPNRRLLADRLAQAIASARRSHGYVSMLALDLDRFKEVNDLLGHRGGDALLVEVGRRLQAIFRREVDTVARVGGDEFAILLPGVDAATALTLVAKLQRGLEFPLVFEGHTIDIHASVGVATFPEQGNDAQQLLRNADSAMYDAKQNHSRHAVWDPRSAQLSIERLSLMSDLRAAVENDELVLYFQPQVDLRDPHALAAEVLVRWQHPLRGLIMPDRFIPFAEQTGYIGEITRWVLDRALAQSAAWRAAGLDVGLSVNVSARDLMGRGFPRVVGELLARHRCPADRLMLELTETAVLRDPTQALQTLEALHAMGCRLSLDDFGTGYSSLAYLQKMPVDELKIDRSFVMRMAEEDGDAVIVRSTIDLGHHMGLRVVAEGVEDGAVLERLAGMGCDVAQGYHVGRPVDATAFEEWISARREASVAPLARAA